MPTPSHREVAQIDALLEGASGGASASILLVGEAGIGKTELLRAAAEAAGPRGLEVLRTRGFESETGIPFAGLLELLTPPLPLHDRTCWRSSTTSTGSTTPPARRSHSLAAG